MNRTYGVIGEHTTKREALDDTTSAYSFDVYASQRDAANPLVRENSEHGDKAKAINLKMKDIVQNYLAQDRAEKATGDRKKNGFFQKKTKRTDRTIRAVETVDDLSIQNIVKKMKSAKKRLHQNLVTRYQSMVKYWERAYLFRFRIVEFRENKAYAKKRYLIDNQEKNLSEMENLYGKRQATYLRGTYMRESKAKYQQWEKNFKALQAKIEKEIKSSEEKMFKNCFKYVPNLLYADDNLSLTTLEKEKTDQRIGYDNVGQRHLFHYMTNAMEICDLVVSETTYWISEVEQYVGAKFEQQHIDVIRQMLDLLLEIFRTRVKDEELVSILQKVDPNSGKKVEIKVHTIMLDKIKLVPVLVDEWLRECIEYKLLEIKVASLFSNFYQLSGNIEKSYILMTKAYKHNKKVMVH